MNTNALINPLPVLVMAMLLIIVLYNGNSYASKKTQAGSADECVRIASSLDRLECFDAYFESPVYLKKNSGSNGRQSQYPTVFKMALNQERSRNNNNITLLQKSYKERDDNEQQRIMLTTPALSGFIPRPILIISCVQNITRFQIGMKEKIADGEIKLNLELDGKPRYTDHIWRVVGNDHLIDAGRGLPGIEFIKTLFYHQRLKFISDNSIIDGLTFDISALAEKIKPLRYSCHW